MIITVKWCHTMCTWIDLLLAFLPIKTLVSEQNLLEHIMLLTLQLYLNNMVYNIRQEHTTIIHCKCTRILNMPERTWKKWLWENVIKRNDQKKTFLHNINGMDNKTLVATIIPCDYVKLVLINNRVRTKNQQSINTRENNKTDIIYRTKCYNVISRINEVYIYRNKGGVHDSTILSQITCTIHNKINSGWLYYYTFLHNIMIHMEIHTTEGPLGRIFLSVCWFSQSCRAVECLKKWRHIELMLKKGGHITTSSVSGTYKKEPTHTWEREKKREENWTRDVILSTLTHPPR